MPQYKQGILTEDLYTLLRVDPGSGPEVIDASYYGFRERVTRFAPGITIDENELESKFPEVFAGYAILRDPGKKAEYDLGLKLRSENALPVKTSYHVEDAKITPVSIRERLSDAAAYAGFFLLVILALTFLYMLANYSL
jgi:hypothetical protein